MLDRRAHRRTRSLIAGRIVFNGGASAADCVLRDLSPAGARLAFSAAPRAVPDVLDLHLPERDRRYRARLRWRAGDVLGVAFAPAEGEAPAEAEAPPAAEPIPLAMARKLKACEADRERLRRRIEQLTGG